MKNLSLAKCSSILKDPYDPIMSNPFKILQNKILTFTNLKNFQSYFFDFRASKFSEQAKQIFDEVGFGLRNQNIELFSRNLNENIYYALRDERLDYKNVNDDYLIKSFPIKNFDWKIVHARTLYLDDFDLSQIYSQITMKYSTDEKPENYIVFERSLIHDNSFYNWKIFILDYQNYRKY